MLDLLYYKCNPFNTTVKEGCIFLKKYLRLQLERKMLEEDIIFTQVSQ